MLNHGQPLAAMRTQFGSSSRGGSREVVWGELHGSFSGCTTGSNSPLPLGKLQEGKGLSPISHKPHYPMIHQERGQSNWSSMEHRASVTVRIHCEGPFSFLLGLGFCIFSPRHCRNLSSSALSLSGILPTWRAEHNCLSPALVWLSGRVHPQGKDDH